MKLDLVTKLSGTKGQSLVELAFVLPMLVTLVLAVFDVSRAIHAKSVITNMSREGANLFARGGGAITTQEIMDSLVSTASPLVMDKAGLMYLTEVQKVNGVYTVTNQDSWRKNSGDYGGSITQANVASVLGSADRPLIHIFEVVYKYDSLFVPPSYSPITNLNLYSVTLF